MNRVQNAAKWSNAAKHYRSLAAHFAGKNEDFADVLRRALHDSGMPIA